MLTVLILASSAMLMQKSGHVLAGQTRRIHESRTSATETIDAALRQVQSETTAPVQSPSNPKSDVAAILLSLGGTIVPMGVGLLMATQEQGPFEKAVSTSLVVAAAIGGPLTGYIYADETSRGLKGFGTRCFVALGFGMWALAIHDEEHSSSYFDPAILPLVVGSISILLLVVKAIVKVGSGFAITIRPSLVQRFPLHLNSRPLTALSGFGCA